MRVVNPESFFVSDGDFFRATAATIGPWSAGHQHGGPPAALVVRALEKFGDDAAKFLVSRVTYDFLKPVPVGRCTVAVDAVKLGSRVQRLTARLIVDGDEVMRAAAIRVRRGTLDTQSPRPAAERGVPEKGNPFVFPFFKTEPAYHTAIEGRFTRGTWGENQVFCWLRARVPLVAGESTSPLQRVMTVADAESGICPPLDVDRYTFVNPDLTVVLDREPEGEWVGLDAVSTAGANGIGLAQSALYDQQGLFGRAAQVLFVEKR
jgi:Thioesterase-like superfamily